MIENWGRRANYEWSDPLTKSQFNNNRKKNKTPQRNYGRKTGLIWLDWLFIHLLCVCLFVWCKKCNFFTLKLLGPSFSHLLLNLNPLQSHLTKELTSYVVFFQTNISTNAYPKVWFHSSKLLNFALFFFIFWCKSLFHGIHKSISDKQTVEKIDAIKS